MTDLRKTGSIIALIGLVAFSTGAIADGPEAIATAAQHAGLAAAAGDITGVHRHLHHTLNCLVGPDGNGFDGSAGNPCNAAGGAIPQTADAGLKATLEEVAMSVRGAIANDNISAAKEAAMTAQASLE